MNLRILAREFAASDTGFFPIRSLPNGMAQEVVSSPLIGVLAGRAHCDKFLITPYYSQKDHFAFDFIVAIAALIVSSVAIVHDESHKPFSFRYLARPG